MSGSAYDDLKATVDMALTVEAELNELRRLRAAAAQAVRALVPVLPVVGSPKRGYSVSEADVRGSRAEVEAAAAAVCELHRALSKCE